MKKQILLIKYKRFHLFFKWKQDLLCFWPCLEYKKFTIGNLGEVDSFYLSFLDFGLSLQIYK